MPEVSDSLSAVIGWRALKSARALADPHFNDANDAALQALDLRRVARIIGTPRFGHKGLSQFLLRRVARIFGTRGGPRKIAHDLRILRVLPAGFSLFCGS